MVQRVLCLLLLLAGVGAGCTSDEDRALEQLTSADPSVRQSAIWTLRSAKYRPAVPALIEVMKTDPSHYVREHAAGALGKIGDRRATQPLLTAALSGDEKSVRIAAFFGLSRLRDPASVPMLIDLWRLDEPNMDERIFVSQGAYLMLFDMRDLSFDPLIRVLSDNHSNVRQWAVQTLDYIGDKQACIHLAKLVDDPDGRVRFEVNDALDGLCR